MASRRAIVLILIAFSAFSLNVPPTSSSTVEHDLGNIGACETAPALTYCDGIIQHEIPASFARQSQILEFYIEKSVGVNYKNDLCKESVKRALCKQWFPVCFQSENRLKIESDGNCQQDIRKNCVNESRPLPMKGLCKNYSAVLHAESCRTLKDHSNRTSHIMKVCNLQSNELKLTDWMFHFLKQMDAQIDVSYTIKRYSQCYPDFVKYHCSYGHCDGGSIKSNNTQEGCIAMLEW